MLLSRTDRADLGALVAEAADGPDLMGVLADRLEDLGVGDIWGLRQRPCLPALITCAASLGGHVRYAALCCRTEWARWIDRVHLYRSNQTFTNRCPEVVPSDPYCPTLREAEGSETYRHWIMSLYVGRRAVLLCGKAHVRRLCERALRGEDVPLDVQRDCVPTAQRMRAILRTLAPAQPYETGESGDFYLQEES